MHEEQGSRRSQAVAVTRGPNSPRRKIQIDYGQLFAPNDARLTTADVQHLQAMEHSTREGLQELFHKAFESFRSSVQSETAKITMEVDDRVAKRKAAEATDAEDAALANSDLPPTATPLPHTAPLAPPAHPPTTQASSSAEGGGTSPQATRPPPKHQRTADEETPDQKQKRLHADAVKIMGEASAARGRKAFEDLQAAGADDEFGLPALD